jgi:PAS domain S-box-containing protein
MNQGTNQASAGSGFIPDLSSEQRIAVLESRLADLEIRFRTLAENFPRGHVSILDEHARILFSAGQDYLTDMGSVRPAAGDRIEDHYGENYAAFLREAVEQCLKGESDEFDFHFEEGSNSVQLIPLPDEKGQIRRVMKIVRNVSSERAAMLDAHHRREYLRQIIDVDPNFIFVKDRSGKVIVANKTISGFFGLPVKEFLEQSENCFVRYQWNYEEMKQGDEQVFTTLRSRSSEEAFFHPETGKMHLFQFTRTPFVGRENELSILCVGVEITERLNTENELRTQREYLRQILDTNPSLIFVKDPAGRFLMVNQAFANHYRMTVEEFTGKTDEDLPLTEEQCRRFAEEDAHVSQSAETITREVKSKHPVSGETCHFVVTKKLLLDAEGNQNILGIITEVSELKKHQEKVQKSEFLLQQVFKKVADALLIADAGTLRIEDCNERAEKMFESGDGTGLKERRLHSLRVSGERSSVFWDEFIRDAREKMSEREVEMVNFSGEKFWGSLALTSFSLEERELLLLRISDISRQKESEEHFIQSLHEKEILIQEIHHRVKNNMAVISSLLQLQGSYFKDPALTEVFRDSQSRIKSMALIHEKLYQSSTLSKVEMESYIRELTRTLYYTYSAGKVQLEINTEAENIFLDINSAVPCGLIINEVFSNACKHAFRDRSRGKIDVLFRKSGEQFELEIRDDGAGLPEDTDPAKVQSLGMNLIQALSSQLGASLEYLHNPGFGIRLQFVEKQKPGREKVLRGQ